MTAGAGGRSVAAPEWVPLDRLPACLGDLSHPPAGLWCHGATGDLMGAPNRHVAIVGTREASSYGLRTATRLATACARAGLVVVSGLARGVDAAAHEAAMRAGGRTVAVLGTGVDVPYPAGHRTLLAEVVARGLAVSEMEPGTRAGPGCFPRRNRLIAGLCRVVVVVEAGHRSGAINTASQALELGRTVAAVPGPIDDPRSAGANVLCRDGAQVICSVDDLLMLYGLSTAAVAEGGGGRPDRPGVPGGVWGAGELEGFGESAHFGDPVGPDGALSVRQLSAALLARELAESGGDSERGHDT